MSTAARTNTVHLSSATPGDQVVSRLVKIDWLAMGDAIAKAKADAGQPVPAPSRRRSQKRKPTSNVR